MTNSRVAIVTGAAQGIGEAIALRLAKDGYSIVLADLESSIPALQRVATAVEAEGVRSAVIACDVTVKKQVDALVDGAVAVLGRVDCMVANAGICPTSLFLDIDEELLDKVTKVNINGVLWCYQAAARQMIKQGEGGKLIAACSIAGIKSSPNFGAYCMTKFAVRSLNQTAALEFAAHGITCNVYCPSPVQTEMWTGIDQEITGRLGAPKGAVTQQFKEGIPLGRLAVAKDISNLVSFLAGPDSGYITGESMIVSGGSCLQ